MPTISVFFGIVIRMFYAITIHLIFMQSIRGKMLRLISMASYSKVKLIPEPPNHSSENGRGYTKLSSPKIGRKCVRGKNLRELNL